jgi:hypothetical protein
MPVEEDKKMLKSTLLAAALITAAALPAFSATAPMAKCDEATMTSTQTKIDGMTDATKKAAATKQMTMAQTAMKSHKMKACSTHLDNAMKSMGTM